jgi:hypothetical protein
VRRLAEEAHGQGAPLSQTDLALLLGSSQKTISTIVIGLREHGELLPLRGYLADMGRWPTHKQAVIRLYLQGLTSPDIAARTRHTKQAVDRYIEGFERLRLLAAKFAEIPSSMVAHPLPLEEGDSASPRTRPTKWGSNEPIQGKRLGPRSATPRTCGRASGGMAGRSNRSSATMCSPAAVMAATVSRLGWQPPTSQPQGRSSRSCQRASRGSSARTCS